MPGQSKESCRWVALGTDADSYAIMGQSKASCKFLAAAESLAALQKKPALKAAAKPAKKTAKAAKKTAKKNPTR